jgi:hypothetical protein
MKSQSQVLEVRSRRWRKRRDRREQVAVAVIWTGITLATALGLLLLCAALWIVWPS